MFRTPEFKPYARCIYSATTLTKAARQTFLQVYRIKIVEVNNSFLTSYRCNQAVHYKGNKFVVISISNYFKTFEMPVVMLCKLYKKNKFKLNFVQSMYMITLLSFSQEFLLDSLTFFKMSTNHFNQPQGCFQRNMYASISKTNINNAICGINYRKVVLFISQEKLRPELERKLDFFALLTVSTYLKKRWKISGFPC